MFCAFCFPPLGWQLHNSAEIVYLAGTWSPAWVTHGKMGGIPGWPEVTRNGRCRRLACCSATLPSRPSGPNGPTCKRREGPGITSTHRPTFSRHSPVSFHRGHSEVGLAWCVCNREGHMLGNPRGCYPFGRWACPEANPLLGVQCHQNQTETKR